MKRRTKRDRNVDKTKIVGIDLFCGAGALTYGLSKAGIDIRLGVDIDPSCDYPFSANNSSEFLLESVTNLKGSDLLRVYQGASVRLLAGCAPCQTFSSYYQKANSDDTRWWLLSEFSRLVGETMPELVTMENVPGLRDKEVFDEFVEKLRSWEYRIFYDIVDCYYYGVPQHRNRLVLLASRLGAIELLPPSKFSLKKKTVRDIIGRMPPLEAGGTDSSDPLHQCSGLSELNLKRMRASRPGGTWRDWDKILVSECHRRDSGKTYPGVYGRMRWDDVAPTITTQFFGFGNGRFGHPDQNRAISLREGAMLQGFPKKYKFVKSKNDIHKKTIGRLVGNAVPVWLGRVIGKSFVEHVRKYA